MALIHCPECGTKISDKAVTCPHCGFTSTDAIVPISALPPIPQKPKVMVRGAEVFGDGADLILRRENDTLAEFLMNAERMSKAAPTIYDFIKKMMDRGEVKYTADFSKAAEELLEKGELIFSIEKKTGKLLPQLRRSDNGQVFEIARLKAEHVPTNVSQTLVNIQTQAMMADLMGTIEAVAANVEALRIENHADKIALAKATWQKLEQALLIDDTRLREIKVLDASSDATKARNRLQAHYAAQISMLEGKTKAKEKALAASNAMEDLAAIALMAKTEYAANMVLGEEAAARAAIEQFNDFSHEHRLSDRNTLLKLNSFNSEDRPEIVLGYASIARNIEKVCLQAPGDKHKQLSAGSAEKE